MIIESDKIIDRGYTDRTGERGKQGRFGFEFHRDSSRRKKEVTREKDQGHIMFTYFVYVTYSIEFYVNMTNLLLSFISNI